MQKKDGMEEKFRAIPGLNIARISVLINARKEIIDDLHRLGEFMERAPKNIGAAGGWEKDFVTR